MKCAEVQELLSAYYDGEVKSEVSQAIAEHLRDCDDCQRELDGFKRLSKMAHGLHSPMPPTDGWERLQTKLDAAEGSRTAQRRRLLRAVPGLAIATTLVTIIVLVWLTFSGLHKTDHDEFASVFGQYLKSFHTSPTNAQHFLLGHYEGKSIATNEAKQLIGYTPAATTKLPAQYNLDAVYVWKMPCCKCVQVLCTRADGTTVAIFEHDDAQPHWFGHRPSITAACGGRHCNLVQMENQLAATWQHGQRHITVIGLRDVDEIGSFVSALTDTPTQDGPG